ncbi:GNAT family N-acetyltransferase [Aquipseudomonas alcaligenes]|nr:GNAT family N-acetyltransferase [Pseudomonas alcaligenes]
MDAVEVVQFAPEDLEVCLGLWAEAVAITYAFLSDEAIQHQRKVVARLSGVDTYIARVRGLVVGFVSINNFSLLGLFVTPAFQRRGIGKALVEHVAQCAPRLSVVVYQSNIGALAFYRKLGFDMTDVRNMDGDGFPYPVFEMRRGIWDA